MASDLYQNVLKDKDNLDRTNPRFRSGAFSSSDFEYKNFLSAVKTRSKSNSFMSQTDNNKQHHPPRANSFVDSALKAQKVKVTNHNDIKTNDQSLTKKETTNKHGSENFGQSATLNVSTVNPESEVEFDSCGSVGKLRSMFDSPSDNNTINNDLKNGMTNSINTDQLPFQSVDLNITKNKKNSLKKKVSSEFENFEDRIVPTGKARIDVDSILAPEVPDNKTTNESKDNIDIEPKENNISFRKELDVERLKRTDEEVSIEKRFNIKRRSLKDKLKDILSSNNVDENSNEFKNIEDQLQVQETFHQDEIIDKNNSNYKSAVERFDEFLNKEVTPPLNNNFDVELESDEKNLTLEDGDLLIASSETDINSSTLMDSILNHIEDSKTSSELDLSLFRPSSQSDSITSDNNAPEVSPRFSKMNATLVEADSIVEEKENEVQAIPEMNQDGYNSASTACPSDSEEDEDTSDMDYEEGTASEDEEYDEEEETEESFILKSCLSKSRAQQKKKLVFNDRKIENVILTYGPSEYDRANADIDPIASSAEWELEKRVDNMDIFSVDLKKDERGLGLSIIGLGVGTETGVEKLGIFVKTLTENGASQKDARIQVNDQILEVNGVSLVGVTQYFAAQTLKNTNGVVRFLMGREKSRRSHFAPGSAMAENPDMQKHIQEMKQTLQQLEDVEERALFAEKTLEEVREDLLSAEERAHETEQQLQETKEQLKVVTESPFVNGQKKLKNEIKKKSGKNEKMDDLHKSLKDISKRLSSSEENLLEMANNNDSKEKQIAELETKVKESNLQNEALELSNEKMKCEFNLKVDEVNILIERNEKLSVDLQQALDQLKKDKENWKQQENELIKQYTLQLESNKKELEDLKENNEQLKKELIENKGYADQKLLAQEKKWKEDLTQYEDLKVQVNYQGDALLENTNTMKAQTVEIEQLKDTKEYLQSLITKFDDSEGEAIQQLNTVYKAKENDLNREKEILLKKISSLEELLANKESLNDANHDEKIFSGIIDTPPLPQRKIIEAASISSAPAIERDRKPDKLVAVSESTVTAVLDSVVESNPLIEQDISTISQTDAYKETQTEDSVQLESALNFNKAFISRSDSLSTVGSSQNSVESIPELNFKISQPNINDNQSDVFVEEDTVSLEVVAQVESSSGDDILSSVVTDAEEEPFLVIETPNKFNNLNPYVNENKEVNLKLSKHDNASVEVNPTEVKLEIEAVPLVESTNLVDSKTEFDQISTLTHQTAPTSTVKQSEIETFKLPEEDISKHLKDDTIKLSEEETFNLPEKETFKLSVKETFRLPEEDTLKLPADNTFQEAEEDTLKLSVKETFELPEEEEVPKNTKKEQSMDGKLRIYIEESKPELLIKHDESVDEGQFEMVIEDLQEEPNTPLTLTKHNVDHPSELSSSSSDEDDDTGEGLHSKNNDDWLGEQGLKRMDTMEKEKQAELIAEQVLLKSPAKRQTSIASSSSSEDEEENKHDSLMIEEESLDRKQSIKIDSSYFEKSNLEESFDFTGVSILDDEAENAKHGSLSLKKSSSFDSVIPATTVLDTRVLQARRAITKFENKRKPTRGIHGSIADGLNDEFQVSTFSESASKVEFKSTPNLLASSSSVSTPDRYSTSLPRSNSLSSSTTKPEKKHRFPFHIPKVFKKSKHHKKSSQHDPVSPSSSYRSSSSIHTAQVNGDLQPIGSPFVNIIPNNEGIPTEGGLASSVDSEVVPMHEKNEVINQANANDVATEEAVVPFADKEQLMSSTNNNISDGVSLNEHSKRSSFTSESSQQSNVAPRITGRLGSDASNTSVFNERGIDVGFSKDNVEVSSKNTLPNQWSATQVGLWLVQRNFEQYVNQFKQNNVDGQLLLRADGNKLKEYGVTNNEDRVEIKKSIKELRSQVGKDVYSKNKSKDKSNKYQFWKGKYKVVH